MRQLHPCRRSVWSVTDIYQIWLLSALIVGWSVEASAQSAPAAEARALWVARMSYKTPDDVRRIIQNAADYHFNIVVFQVRGNATAWYRSELEPWAWELTGEDPSTLGTDPGWDPLQLAIDEARREAEEMLLQFDVIYPSEPLVRLALRGSAAYQLPWFDAHLWAFAELNGLEELISEDFQDGRLYGTVRVRNPFA